MPRHHRPAPACLPIVLALFAVAVAVSGCDRNTPRPDPPVAEIEAETETAPAPVRLAFGDCAGPTAAFVTGPRPSPFDRAAVEEHMASLPAVPEEASASAGIAEHLEATEGAFTTFTGNGIGGDDEVYGGLLGDEVGEVEGGFGIGTSGVGPGGGGTGWGTIGTGSYGHIGHGSGSGSGYGAGAGRGGMRGRNPVTPSVRIGNAVVSGDLDKNIIRRYVRRKLPRIKYCYEKQLLIDGSLSGTVVAEFTITSDGAVAGATATGVDHAVGACIADTLAAIQFPKPKGGGSVKVRYPFTFTSGAPAAARPAPAEPPTRSEPEPPYAAGQANPLRAEAPALEACLRGQPAGTVVVELEVAAGGAVTASEAFGLGDQDAAGCVAQVARTLRWPEGPGVTRCALAFGTDEPGAARGIDITAGAITLDGQQVATSAELSQGVAASYDALYQPLAAASETLRYQPEQVVVDAGPVILRPVDATPMKLVYQVEKALTSSGAYWLLAAQSGDRWRLLDDVILPVVPVPLGTGEDWRARRRPSGPSVADADPPVELSILVTDDAVEVALTRGPDPVSMSLEDGAIDSAALIAILRQLDAEHLSGHHRIDIGATDAVPYGRVAQVIDAARSAGFTEWILVDPVRLGAADALRR